MRDSARDLAVRQAQRAHADLQVIRLALNEARPLEALRTSNEAIERLDEELEAIEDLEAVREAAGDPPESDDAAPVGGAAGGSDKAARLEAERQNDEPVSNGGGRMADAGAVEVGFGADEWDRIERAVDAGGFADPTALVRDGALQVADEVLDGNGQLECPHDDCDETFARIRERRGHLGSSEHALDVPEGEFWCGYCGYGPTSWRGVNAHHGSSDHDGDPVRIDEEPVPEDLIAPEDIPDHKDSSLLADLYEEHDGTITDMCRAHDFDVGQGRVRHYLIEFEIHDPTSHGAAEDGDGPIWRDPQWLEDQYEAADGNISEMHRQIDVDVPYRTLQKNLKRFDVHDPTDPPGKKRSWDHRDDQDDPSKGTSDDADDVGGDDQVYCGVCGDGFDSERGLKIHHGRSDDHEGDADIWQTPVDVDEDAGDTPAEEAREDQNGDDHRDIGDDSVGSETPSDPDPKDRSVESFEDLSTPDWMDEASFFAAVEMADDVEELADTLGWPEHDRLDEIVELLEIKEDLYGPEEVTA
jgi:hypothetical protein